MGSWVRIEPTCFSGMLYMAPCTLVRYQCFKKHTVYVYPEYGGTIPSKTFAATYQTTQHESENHNMYSDRGENL
jgi:hypothetical protein